MNQKTKQQCTNEPQNQNMHESSPTIVPEMSNDKKLSRISFFNEAQERYKRLSDHLQKECSVQRDRFEQILLKNKSLKQNFMEMDKQKQKIIKEFQEEFEILTKNLKLMTQLDERIPTMGALLESTFTLEKNLEFIKKEEFIRFQEIMKRIEDDFERLKNLKDTSMKILDNFHQSPKDESRRESMKNLCTEIQHHLKVCREIKTEIECQGKTLVDSFKIVEAVTGERNSAKIEIDEMWQKYRNLNKQMITKILDLRCSVQAFKTNSITLLSSKKENIKKLGERLVEEKADINKLLMKKTDRKNRSMDLSIQEEELKLMFKDANNLLRGVVDKQTADNSISLELENEMEKIRNALQIGDYKLSSLEQEKRNLESKKTALLAKIEERRTIYSQKEKVAYVEQETSTLKFTIFEVGKMIATETQEKIALQSEINELEIKLKDLERKTEKLFKTIDEMEINEPPQLVVEKNILAELMKIKEEEVTFRKSVKHKVDILCSKFVESIIFVADLQINTDQMKKDTEQVQKMVDERQKEISQISKDEMDHNRAINILKKNVRNGTFITWQDLNKRLQLMTEARDRALEELKFIQEKRNTPTKNKK